VPCASVARRLGATQEMRSRPEQARARGGGAGSWRHDTRNCKRAAPLHRGREEDQEPEGGHCVPFL
jgi:hypothetical protein